MRQGLYLPPGKFLAPTAPAAAVPLCRVRYEADLKDGTLLALRRRFLSMAKTMEDAGDQDAAAAVRIALSFVRRVAGLPAGYKESLRIIGARHPTDDESDLRVRRRFFVDGALSALDQCLRVPGAFNAELNDVYREVSERLTQWDAETPISLKLKGLLASGLSGTDTDLVVLQDSDALGIFHASALAERHACRVVEARRLGEAVASQDTALVILVQPSLESLRTVLTLEPSPARVALVGDAAGAGLMAMELRPVAELPGFEPVRERAKDMLKALLRSEADLALDEAEARFVLPSASQELDFTQGGQDGRYGGPVVRLVTERGYALKYRPGSEVLRHTPDEIRAFEKVHASALREGDAILVLTQRLMEEFRIQLAGRPKTVETLRLYHRAVAEKCAALSGSSLRDKARRVLRRIQELDPAFASDEVDNVVRWLRVGGATLDDPGAPPQAPRTLERFLLFAAAVGISPQLAQMYWDTAIRPTRAYRISEGLQFHDRAVGFIVDPEGVMARAAGQDYTAVRQAIFDNLDVVRSREVLNVQYGA